MRSCIDIWTRVRKMFLTWYKSGIICDMFISRCNYGMVPLGSGVAYCAGEEWSEVLLTMMRLMFILIDWAIMRRYWKVLECGEAVALLVGGEEQFNGWFPFPSPWIVLFVLWSGWSGWSISQQYLWQFIAHESRSTHQLLIASKCHTCRR